MEPLTRDTAYAKMREYWAQDPTPPIARFDGACCYRTPEGTRCAVGCLIPDELYDEMLENCGSVNTTWLSSSYPIVRATGEYLSLDDEATRTFLRTCQGLHDAYARSGHDMVPLIDLAYNHPEEGSLGQLWLRFASSDDHRAAADKDRADRQARREAREAAREAASRG